MKLYPLVHNWWDRNRHVDYHLCTPKPVEVYILRFPTEQELEYHKKNSIISVCHTGHEPRPYKKIRLCHESHRTEEFDYEDFIWDNAHKVDYIFDYDIEAIDVIPNCIKTLAPYTHINEERSLYFKAKPKEFNVSFVCTNKSDTDMHLLRQLVWNEQDLIKTPKKFYNSGRLPMQNDFGNPSLGNGNDAKSNLFDSMFSIAIENAIETNFFTEKIVDCFASKTIPVYYGCPNISDFFDEDGILFANSEQDVIDICNSLTPDIYYSKLHAVNTNYALSQPYLGNVEKRIRKNVKDNIFPDFNFGAF